MNFKGFKKAAAVLAAVSLMVSSVGFGASDGTQGVTSQGVKVGTIAVQSGPYAVIGTPYVDGMRACFDSINAAGGINGRFIYFTAKDDEFKTDKAIAAAESLLTEDEVFAVVGQLGTPGVKAAAITLKEAGIPAVYFGSGDVALTRLGNNFFPVQPNYEYEGKLMAHHLVKNVKAKNVVVLYQNDAVGKQGLKGIEDGMKALKSSAYSSKNKIAYNSTDKDFTAQIQKAKALNPDYLVIYGLPGGTLGIMKEMEKVSFNVPMLTTYSFADKTYLALGKASAPTVVKNIHVTGWLDINELKVKSYVTAMKKYSPKTNPDNAYAMAGWVAAETFVEGLKLTGKDLTWTKYIAAMDKMTFKTGLASEVKFSKGVREGVRKMSVSKVVEKNDTLEFALETNYFEYVGK